MKTIVELAKAFYDQSPCIRVVDLEQDADTGVFAVKNVAEYPVTLSAAYIALNCLDYDPEREIEFRDPLESSEVFLSFLCDNCLTDAYLGQRGVAMLLLHHYGFTDNCGIISLGAGDPIVTAYRNSDPKGMDNSVYTRIIERHMRK